jgi:Flp pilus assembly protein CpaB
MADHGTATYAPPAVNGSHHQPAGRPVTRRRSLPGSRAVFGGLLVAASAVGLFAAYGASERHPADTYVVAARDVPGGEVFTAADLGTVAIDLPAGQRAVSFTDASVLVGNVTTVRLHRGQLIQSSLVTRPTSTRALARISVPVEPGHAMNGIGLDGERVDVIVTYTDGGTPRTDTVARGVQIVQVLRGDRSLGTSGQLTVVLAVRPGDLEPVAGAAAAGTITLARTTRLQR